MKHRLPAVAAIIAAIGSGGCGGSKNGPSAFLGKASNAAIYVSWNRDGDNLTGTLTESIRDDQHNKVNNDRASFSGTVKDGGVSINLNEGLGSITTLTGTLHGKKLDLDFSGSNGAGITTVHLAPASSSEYNVALASLQRQASDQAADAQQAADDQTARDDAAEAAQTLRSDLQALSATTSGGPAVYRGDLSSMQDDLVTTKDDLATVQKDAGSSDDSFSTCSDADTVSSDVDTIRSDIDTLTSDHDSASSNAPSQDAMEHVRQEYAALASFDPRYLPADAPSQQDVDAAFGHARAVRHTVNAAAKTALAQGESVLGIAKGYESQAQATCTRVGD